MADRKVMLTENVVLSVFNHLNRKEPKQQGQTQRSDFHMMKKLIIPNWLALPQFI